jgi:hypothetical protein
VVSISSCVFSLILCALVSSVGHGYGFTRSFQATGHTVTGTVPDFNTCRDTVPITAVSRYCMNTLSLIALTFINKYIYYSHTWVEWTVDKKEVELSVSGVHQMGDKKDTGQ